MHPDPLPTELLFMVFEHVYAEQSRGSSDLGYPGWGQALLWESKLTPNPSLFPYALAHVSPRWKDILLTVPKYWTRLVFTLDHSSSSFTDLPSHLRLAASCDLPMQIHARPSSAAHLPCRSREASCVSQMMKLVSPHISRCTRLSIISHHSSSLPSVCAAFSARTSEGLHFLQLDCAKAALHTQNLMPTCKLSFFSISVLSLSGGNVFELFTAGSAWLRGRTITWLALSDYQTPESADGGLSHAKLIRSLVTASAIRHLCLKRIRLCASDTDPVPTLRLESLNLTEIEPELTATLICAQPTINIAHFAVITRCTLPATRPLSHCHLILNDIVLDTSVIAFIRYWNGHELTLRRCAFVDEVFFNAMAEVATPGEMMCQFLYRLIIDTCGTISVPALKAIVERRTHVLEMQGRKQISPGGGFFVSSLYLEVRGNGLKSTCYRS